MVSGRRGISKCTAAVTSSLRLGPQEPLLFLYPTWARGITTHPAPTITNEAYPILDSASFYASQAPPPESVKTRRSDQSQTGSATRETVCDNGPADNDRLAYVQYNAEQSPTTDDKSLDSVRYRPVEPTELILPRRAPSRRNLKEKIHRVVGNEFYQSKKAYFDGRRRQRTYENARFFHEAEEASPAAVLDDLVRYTLKRTPGAVRQIQVPESALPGLLFGMENNIMQIKHRTGAEIDLLEEEDSDGMRRLGISGPSIAVELAAATIIHATPGAISRASHRSPLPLRFSTKEPIGRSRNLVPRYVLCNPDRRYTPKPMRADAIPVPDFWTPESLHTYVTSLTRMRMPSGMHQLLYGPDEAHQMIVFELLDGVFDNDDCLQVMSLTTLNEGISYFMKKNQIHFVRDIYYKVQLRGMRLSTETFNIMLRGAAKVSDLDTFASLVNSMLNKGYRPDSGTWIAFLSMLTDSRALEEVVKAMRESGLFHEAGVQAEVCDIVAPLHLKAGLDRVKSRASFDGFAQQMEAQFTKEWLTLSGANKLLKVLGGRGLISECWILIRFMEQHGIRPDIVSYNTTLDACCEYSGFQTGIDLLERLKRHYHFAPDSVTWAILFKHAWEGQHYVASRFIWRHGCLKGWISYSMRARVRNSLKKQFHDHSRPQSTPDAILNSWTNNAGAFVVTNQRAPQAAIQAIQSADSGLALDEIEMLAQLAYEIVKDDTDLFMAWDAVSNPLALLKQALAVDMESAARPVESFGERMKWLNENAPRIPMIKKRSVSPTRGKITAQKAWLSAKQSSKVHNDEPTIPNTRRRGQLGVEEIARLKKLRSMTSEAQLAAEARAELQPEYAEPQWESIEEQKVSTEAATGAKAELQPESSGLLSAVKGQEGSLKGVIEKAEAELKPATVRRVGALSNPPLRVKTPYCREEPLLVLEKQEEESKAAIEKAKVELEPPTVRRVGTVVEVAAPPNPDVRTRRVYIHAY